MSQVRDDQPAHTAQHTRFPHHPIHATEEAAAHLHEVAEEGESPATPAIVAGVVLAFILPLATFLILLAFVLMHFA